MLEYSHMRQDVSPPSGEERERMRSHLSAAIRSFLITRGFRELRGEPDGRVIRFRRSTRFATIFSFDPSRWRIDIELEPRMSAVRMQVHTDGQVVTPRERHYFEAFFAELRAVLEPGTSSATAMTLWGDNAISRRAARAALNENVAVTFGFFFSLPTLIILLKATMAVPMFWAIIWGFIGSIAIAYACLFSVKNRTPRDPLDESTPSPPRIAPSGQGTP